MMMFLLAVRTSAIRRSELTRCIVDLDDGTIKDRREDGTDPARDEPLLWNASIAPTIFIPRRAAGQYFSRQQLGPMRMTREEAGGVIEDDWRCGQTCVA